MSRGGGTPNCSCGNHQPTTLAPVLQTVWEDRWVLQKKPYMSADTWELLERKWAAVDAGEVDEADRYSDLIKRRVKQDKEEHVLEQLETITSQGYKWDGLKRLRDKFTPTFTKFKDADRNHVPFKN